MKNLFLSFLFLLFVIPVSFARKKAVLVTVSPQDAEIYANGQKIGTGSATVIILKDGQTNVTVKMAGYITAEHIFYYQDNKAAPPKTYFFKMEVDDSWTASNINDRANVDFTVNFPKTLSDKVAWRTAVSIVTNYFDVLEISDFTTFYLRTAWQAKTFKANTVRTRVILKAGGENQIKIKLISEQSGEAGTSIKASEKFKSWDRVLRKYNGIISEFQNRLENKK